MRGFQSYKKAILGAIGASPRLMDNMLSAQNREREQVLKELVKVRGMMPLLMKSRNGNRWTNPEQKALREQLRALANLSPYLAVMVLPGSFLVLPALAWWLDRRRQTRKVQRTDL